MFARNMNLFQKSWWEGDLDMMRYQSSGMLDKFLQIRNFVDNTSQT